MALDTSLSTFAVIEWISDRINLLLRLLVKWFPLLAVVAAVGLACITPAFAEQWAGVDESVVERFAELGGRQAAEPFINTDQGDLLLFCFLLAGCIAGFIGGYYFRELFPPRSTS